MSTNFFYVFDYSFILKRTFFCISHLENVFKFRHVWCCFLRVISSRVRCNWRKHGRGSVCQVTVSREHPWRTSYVCKLPHSKRKVGFNSVVLFSTVTYPATLRYFCIAISTNSVFVLICKISRKWYDAVYCTGWNWCAHSDYLHTLLNYTSPARFSFEFYL